MSGAVRLEPAFDGQVQVLTLDHPPGNVIDMATCAELRAALETAAGRQDARALILRSSGKHFSFGASVEEHLPEQAADMLAAIGSVIRDLVHFPYPTVCGIQGRCLGGGLELALGCGILIAEEDAILAAPEIQLGVFAPAATALLSGRGAEEVLLTGRNMTATEAKHFGIVNHLADDGELDPTIDAFVKEHFVGRSASSLRIATKALREPRAAAFDSRLAELEALYLKELLPTPDGSEGIRAFIEKREPRWTHS